MKIHGIRGRAAWSAALLLTAAACGPAPSRPFPVAAPPVEHSDSELKALGCPGSSDTYENVFKPLRTLEEIREAVSRSLHEYGLKILTDPDRDRFIRIGYGWNEIEADNLLNARKFAATLVDAWKRNTPRWVKKSKLKRIFLVKNLVVGGQRRAAMPDDSKHGLYYDVTMLGACMPQDEEIVHHEFYHVVEEAHFGSFYYADPHWRAFNVPGFSYGAGGSAAYTDGVYRAGEHPRPGFVTQYSTYGLEEDKAEVYAWLRTPSYETKLEQWAEADAVLKSKAGYMRAFIAEHSTD